jgi:phosphate starvation-inducible protein PhoH
MSKFRDMDEIGVFEFSEKDIVRNPLITKILKKYEDEVRF